MLCLSLCVTHRADGDHLGIDLSVLTPVPYLAVPMSFFDHTAPHGLVVVLGVSARRQNAGVPSKDLVPAVARDLGKGLVDIHNGAIGPGDGDPLP